MREIRAVKPWAHLGAAEQRLARLSMGASGYDFIGDMGGDVLGGCPRACEGAVRGI